MTTPNELEAAIACLNGMPKVNIKGKAYSTVATRVEVFRKFFPGYALTTELLDSPAPNIVRVRAIISNGAICATGMAEEDRTQGAINKTSALENCETSAVGRALAAFGLHGGEYATADEVAHAIEQQNAPSQGAAKAPPKGDQEAWGGPLKKTELKKKLEDFNADLLACSDADSLHIILNDQKNKAVLDQCKRDLPGWWWTKEGSDAKGFHDRINDRMAELLAKEPDIRG